MNEEKCKKIFETAREYLLNYVSEDILNSHLELGNQIKHNSINELFRGLLESLANRQGMPNSIGNIDNLKAFLFDFNPVLILNEYGNDWKKLFQDIKKDYRPPGKMDITKKKSYWVRFVIGIISGAKFLARFQTIEEFAIFIDRFYLNEYTRVALPMLISKEVDGLGFALACDFLKENGYPEFAKPDTHLISIFNGLGISNSEYDYEVFKDVINFSKKVNEVPYVVDKMFWLIGSGKFHLLPKEDQIKPTNKEDFIKKALNSLNSK